MRRKRGCWFRSCRTCGWHPGFDYCSVCDWVSRAGAKDAEVRALRAEFLRLDAEGRLVGDERVWMTLAHPRGLPRAAGAHRSFQGVRE